MRAFVIPVAFMVEAETETEAAKKLVYELAKATLTQDHAHQYLTEKYGSIPPGASLGPIEKWWTPNHPSADGSDNAGHLVFIDPIINAGDYESLDVENRQLLADAAVQLFHAGK